MKHIPLDSKKKMKKFFQSIDEGRIPGWKRSRRKRSKGKCAAR